MAVITYFGGKPYIEPIVQVKVINGITTPPVSTYGKILIPDTGLGSGWGFGKGSMEKKGSPAICIGDQNVSSGIDYSSNKLFKITVNGGSQKNIALNKLTTSITTLVSHINGCLLVNNVYTVIAYASGNNVGFKSISIGATQSFSLAAGSPDALAGLGIEEGSYVGITATSIKRNLQDFFYEFNHQSDYEIAMKGGHLFGIGDYLYHPDNDYNVKGANSIIYLKASETSPASVALCLNGKMLVIKTQDEGTCANGDITTKIGKLTKGYSVSLVAGTTSYKLQFYQGKWKGQDENGYQFEKTSLTSCADNPSLLFESPEFSDISSFIAWANNNDYFNFYFAIDTDLSDTSGTVVAGDVLNYSGINVFSGATDSFSSNALDNLLAEAREIDYTFILSTEYGTSAASDNTLAILSYIENDKRGAKVMMNVGGMDTRDYRGSISSDTTATSAGSASLFGNAHVTVYHAGSYKNDVSNKKTNVKLPSLYMAAACVGRRAGLRPQDSLTGKTIRTYLMQDIINSYEDREALIQLGVCVFKSTDAGYIVDLDVNTLRGDDNLEHQTSDSNGNMISYHNYLMQIREELTRRLINIFTPIFIGTKFSEYSTASVKSNVCIFLGEQIKEGLILTYSKVTVERNGSATFVFVEYSANGDNEQLFFTLSATV